MIEAQIPSEQSGVDVLVVDDEPMVRDFIARVLTRNGYASRTAGDAGEALAAMNDRAPTVVISDIRMPGKDGAWLLEELKKRWPEIPVIMLTAVSEATQAVECLKAGAHDYLVKPIDIDALLASVLRGAGTTELRRVHGQRKELDETVRSRPARLRSLLETIEAAYRDELRAAVNAVVGEALLPWPGSVADAAESKGESSLDGQTIELSALRTAGKLVAEGATHLEVARAVGEELVDKAHLLYARLWLRQRNEHDLEAAVEVGATAEAGMSLANKVLATGTTEREERDGVVAVAAPVVVRGACECALELGWCGERRADMLAVADSVARILSASLAREQEARERNRAAEELQLFHKLASANRYSLDLEPVAASLMNSLHRIVDYDVAGLLLLEDEPSLSIRARFAMDPEFVDRARSQIGNALRLTCGVEPPAELDVRLIESERDPLRRDPPHELRSFVNVPISVGGSVVGLIHVSSGKDDAFRDGEILSVHRAAEFLANSVQGVRELLATVKERLEQMVDPMPDGVLMLDGRGRVVAMNGAARRVLGCEKGAEGSGTAAVSELLEGDPVGLMRWERRSLRKLACVRGIPYQTQVSPVIDDDGELVGAVLAFRDVEQEKRIDEKKTELVDVVPLLSERELLLRALSSEIERAQSRDGALSLVLARVANGDELRARVGEEGVERAMNELQAASRNAVRRSSDRVVVHREDVEVAIVLPRSLSDGGRAFASRLVQELSEPLKEAGAALAVSSVEFPRDGHSAEALYALARERMHETTAA